jgi:hypothetical protein
MDTREAAVRAFLVSAFFALALALGIADPAAAQAPGDQILPGCGICYPSGYDPNTVGMVVGTVSRIEIPDDGPVRFTVSDEEEQWIVLASPAWYWQEANARLAAGETVAVHGSKSLGADGKLYVVARTIDRRDGSPAIQLRDDRGVPLWHGNHRGGGMRGGGHRRR